MLIAVSLAVAGCGSGDKAPELVGVEDISQGAASAFQSGQAEIQELSNQVVEALGRRDFNGAWGALQDLNAHPDLTAEQRAFVAQSLASVGAELQKAEQSGDDRARQTLEFHRANK